MTVEKVVFGPTGYMLGIEYWLDGRSFRLRTNDKPREGLYVASRKMGLAALKCCKFPEGLDFGVSSVTFAEGSDPGTAIVFEGMGSKLSLDKIDSADVTKRIKVGEEEYESEYIEDHPRNLFNVLVKEFRDEVEYFVNVQRHQLTLEFEEESKASGVIPFSGKGKSRAVAEAVQ